MKNSIIHIRVPEELKEKAQKKAEEENRTLTQVVTDYLTRWVKS